MFKNNGITYLMKFAVFIVLMAAAALFNFGCEDDEHRKADEAFLKYRAAEKLGKYDDCVRYLKETVKHNPYHMAANRNLAVIYDERLFDEPSAELLAITYYKRYLDLRPRDKSLAELAALRCSMLERIVSGEVEDPADAVKDFLLGAKNNTSILFFDRLTGDLTGGLNAKGIGPNRYRQLWNEWQVGGDSEIVYRGISVSGRKPMATVIVRLPGGKKRALLLTLSDTNVWMVYSDSQYAG